VLADYDGHADTVTVHSSTQSPHLIKRMLAEVLSFPEGRLRVVAPDVSGGFGSKLHLYPEEVLVCGAAPSPRLLRYFRRRDRPYSTGPGTCSCSSGRTPSNTEPAHFLDHLSSE